MTSVTVIAVMIFCYRLVTGTVKVLVIVSVIVNYMLVFWL